MIVSFRDPWLRAFRVNRQWRLIFTWDGGRG